MNKTTVSTGAILVLVIALALLPLVLAPTQIGAMSQMLIAALFALAFSLLIGQGGMLSFGHAAYFAIGCFATIHAMNAAEQAGLRLPTPLMPLAGGLAALVVGAVAGFFATLRSGVYFSMVTLAIAELFHTLAPNLQGVFGGEGGVSAMRMPWAGIGFDQEIHVYYLIFGWTLVSALLMYLYTRTSFGRLTVALRENERRVAFLGYDVHATKVVVFSISSLFAGIAGGLLAVSSESANYMLFNLSYSANVVLFSYIGGTGLFLGPAVGAGLMSILGYAVSDVTRLWLLYQGLIFVLVMMYAPGGILPAAQALVTRGRADGGLPASRVLLSAMPVAMIGCAAVQLLELTSAVFSRDYQTEVARTGRWPAITLLSRSWAPDQLLTWAGPALLLAVGVLFLFRLTRAATRESVMPSGEELAV